MAASRSLYRRLASDFKIDLESFKADPSATRAIVVVIRSTVAPALKADNPNFRYDKFYEACGLNAYGEVL